jgi:hypothetical protein
VAVFNKLLVAEVGANLKSETAVVSELVVGIDPNGCWLMVEFAPFKW